tara:strand:+ start:366 stop:761 length:396 start_codon:yes stop_codon:yes gene_type:complete
MKENWYLITSESILIESQPAMLVSESITTFDTYSEVTESFYSGSVDVFNSSSVVPTDIIWSLNKSLILFGTHQTYTGSYSASFDDYDSVIRWVYDVNTNEEINWSDVYEETLNDPYGIDGPFPEVMDETIT